MEIKSDDEDGSENSDDDDSEPSNNNSSKNSSRSKNKQVYKNKGGIILNINVGASNMGFCLEIRTNYLSKARDQVDSIC